MSQPMHCQICHRARRPVEGEIGELIRPSLLEFMRKCHPEWDGTGFVCFDHISECRTNYVKEVLKDELGELTDLDREVVESLREHELVSSNIAKEFDRELTFGERVSDHMADFGGSWKFLLIFAGVLVVWIITNSVLIATHVFDPYPFILLNLILSCLAAVQAPIIMMSQNRAETRDRLRAENDYKINLKAELEIRHLHEKIDHLLRRQYNRLFEIQQIQIELLEELGRKKKP